MPVDRGPYGHRRHRHVLMRVGYLGLGSNVGDRAEHLRAAIEMLGERGVEVEVVSSGL